MSNDLTTSDPGSFDLKSFADLLPERAPIIGEDPGSFEGFRERMMQSLRPMTPYEGVIAENLIAIEWELMQHRRMRDAGLRTAIRDSIKTAVVGCERNAYEEELEVSWESHVAGGGDADDWDKPWFDRGAAHAKGDAFAERCRYADTKGMEAVCKEIEALGMDALDVMGKAYRTAEPLVTHHEEKIQELERRRREVKRDYDALQMARPVEGKVIDG